MNITKSSSHLTTLSCFSLTINSGKSELDNHKFQPPEFVLNCKTDLFKLKLERGKFEPENAKFKLGVVTQIAKSIQFRGRRQDVMTIFTGRPSDLPCPH